MSGGLAGTVFADLCNALAPFVGGPAVAGYILGFVLIGVLWFAIMLAAGKSAEPLTIFLISGGIGLVFDTAVGWFDYWIPVALVIIVVFAALLFRGSGAASGGGP